MLHEILLSLSGHPSPLLHPPAKDGAFSEEEGLFPLISPPERELLGSLAHLSDLHMRLRSHTTLINSSHPSTICRAVSTAIATEHLGRFQQKILEVEKTILGKDAGYVGGYGIVPLSTVVGEFAPWTRRMEWLWDIARFMLSEAAQGRKPQSEAACTGASIIDHLRSESQTGYSDIEEISLSLVKTAETAWMRQLSTWVLYGKLPSFGAEDFFISKSSQGETHVNQEFLLQMHLKPKFVTSSTASSILFIGRSLNYIRMRDTSSKVEPLRTSSSPEIALLSTNLRHLTALTTPTSSTSLSSAIAAIRLSLSQSALSQILPLPKILEMLSLLQNFLLLSRGEFAVALITHADEYMGGRHSRNAPTRHAKGKTNALDSVTIKEGEVTSVLASTWAELSSLQNEEDPVDEELDLARELFRLSIQTSKSRAMSSGRDIAGASPKVTLSDVSFQDLLFATPTSLSVQVHPPLDLFLTSLDMSAYDTMHAYLLGIRRAHLRLTDLWKRTSLRRCHPTPLGPPLSNTGGGESRLQTWRQRENLRASRMRPMWATGSAATFLLSELGGYLQGEVVNGHWSHFRKWLDPSRPGSSSSAGGSRPVTSSTSRHDASAFSISSNSRNAPDLLKSPAQRDPETLTAAHRSYLDALAESLFLPDVLFTRHLRDLLTSVDHFIALISRLQAIQQNLDLETDDGVVDTLADYASDEKETLNELKQARQGIESGKRDLVARLREIDEGRSGGGKEAAYFTTHEGGAYVPWKGAGIDRLLMKLDLGSLNAPTDVEKDEE